jgi:nicotinamide riboside kinase
MNIAFSGAQCTGKTTLIKQLTPTFNELGLDIITEIARELSKRGFEVNDEAENYDKTQDEIAKIHAFNSNSGTDTVTDRCLIDSLAYSLYLFINGKLSVEACERHRKIFDKHIKDLDIVFYLPIEFPLIDDGFRSLDEEFRNRIAGTMESIISILEIDVVVLTGTLEERVETVKNKLKEKYNG